jgi:hypothetical protein
VISQPKAAKNGWKAIVSVRRAVADNEGCLGWRLSRRSTRLSSSRELFSASNLRQNFIVAGGCDFFECTEPTLDRVKAGIQVLLDGIKTGMDRAQFWC